MRAAMSHSRVDAIRDWAARHPLLCIVALFVVTRCLVVGALHLGATHMTPERRAEWEWITDKSDLFRGPPPSPFLAPFVRWDANFYLAIARDGYPPPRSPDFPVYHVAFFPLFPLVVRAVHSFVHDIFLAAEIVSNAFALLATLLVYWLAGSRAALLLLVAPGSHFLSLPYPEAMFVTFLSAAMLAIHRDRLLLAGLAGALAGATRSAGIVVFVILLYVAWTKRASFRDAARAVAAAAISLAGIAGFAMFCARRYGDALAFAHIQARYVNDRSFKLLGPLKAVFAFTVDPDYYLVTFVALIICVQMVRRSPAVDSLTAWFLLLVPMWTGTLKAMIRYQSANVGLLLGATQMKRSGFAALCAASLALLAIETELFGMGVGHY
jgi:hypothetical protein